MNELKYKKKVRKKFQRSVVVESSLEIQGLLVGMGRIDYGQNPDHQEFTANLQTLVPIFPMIFSFRPD